MDRRPIRIASYIFAKPRSFCSREPGGHGTWQEYQGWKYDADSDERDLVPVRPALRNRQTRKELHDWIRPKRSLGSHARELVAERCAGSPLFAAHASLRLAPLSAKCAPRSPPLIHTGNVPGNGAGDSWRGTLAIG